MNKIKLIIISIAFYFRCLFNIMISTYSPVISLPCFVDLYYIMLIKPKEKKVIRIIWLRQLDFVYYSAYYPRPSSYETKSLIWNKILWSYTSYEKKSWSLWKEVNVTEMKIIPTKPRFAPLTVHYKSDLLVISSISWSPVNYPHSTDWINQ